MAELIIIRGNSGSGKSTLAKEIHRLFRGRALLIPQDTVRREMLGARDDANTPAIPLIAHLLEYGCNHCAITILEGILNAERYRPAFERARSLFGDAHIHAFRFDLPFEETLKRHQTKPNRSEFGEAQMREWWLENDALSGIPETVFTKETSLRQAIRIILNAAAPVCCRPAEARDAETLVQIYDSAFHADFVRFGEYPGYGRSVSEMEASIARDPKQIIERAGVPIGVLSHENRGGGDYHIGCLCIKPEFQNQGAGARAFQDFLAAHPDWTHIALETPLEKEENIRFYTEKCQMCLTGINREGNIPLAILERNR